MPNNAFFTCQLHNGPETADATCLILNDALQINTLQKQLRLDFSAIRSFKLKNYQLLIETSNSTVGLSGLGRQTENFFEKLWLAYNSRCKEALFIEGPVLYEGEGDFILSEQGEAQQGLAKIALYPNCLAIYPQNFNARRFPLCFSETPNAESYRLSLSLDTGDFLQISRLGRNCLDVFEKICHQRSQIIQQWNDLHQELAAQLPNRLGDNVDEYEQMQQLGCHIISGLYTTDSEGFWFAGLHHGKAAVELVSQEQTATYLYQYDSPDALFESTLRHAMESVALHREVIFTDLSDKPLYQMTVQRSRFLQFLRDHNTGRLIHNSGWAAGLSSFFS
ncbi:MAG: hypothetical protein J5642_08125 [Bacteroidales bacterium]|nr:hypothetical protein [Bacteroidales bacterium]